MNSALGLHFFGANRHAKRTSYKRTGRLSSSQMKMWLCRKIEFSCRKRVLSIDVLLVTVSFVVPLEINWRHYFWNAYLTTSLVLFLPLPDSLFANFKILKPVLLYQIYNSFVLFPNLLILDLWNKAKTTFEEKKKK